MVKLSWRKLAPRGGAGNGDERLTATVWRSPTPGDEGILRNSAAAVP